jgi:hypothetical protein
MSKERQIIRRVAKIGAGAILVSSGLSSFSIAPRANVGPPKELSPGGNIFLLDLLSDMASPSLQLPEPSPPLKLSSEDQSVSTVELRSASVLTIMSENPKLFTKKMMNDVKLYYPIYEAVVNAFNKKREGKPPIKWYLLWDTHEIESDASNNKPSFDGGTYPYYGAMQRNVKLWSAALIKQIVKEYNLEYLARFNQRHSDDSQEIAGGTYILVADIDKYEEMGESEDRAILGALTHYSGSAASGIYRDKRFKELEQIFG